MHRLSANAATPTDLRPPVRRLRGWHPCQRDRRERRQHAQPYKRIRDNQAAHDADAPSGATQ